MMEQGNPDRDEIRKNGKKNQYIKKINSLLHVSHDNLAKEKKIKKTSYTLEEHRNETSKQEKNRASAKKARERKKLYIDLLERTISTFRLLIREGKDLQEQSQRFLEELAFNGRKGSLDSIGDIGIFFGDFRRHPQKQEHRKTQCEGKLQEIETYLLPDFDRMMFEESEQMLINHSFFQNGQELDHIQQQLNRLSSEEPTGIKVQNQAVTMTRDQFIEQIQPSIDLDLSRKTEGNSRAIPLTTVEPLLIKLEQFINTKIEDQL